MVAGARERVAAGILDLLLAAAALVASSILLGLVTSLATERWQLAGLAANGVPQPGADDGSTADLGLLRVDVPWWLALLTLALLSVIVVALSGAWSRDSRRSYGLQLGHLSLVPAGLMADGVADAPDDVLPQPPRWRVALRWLAPFAVFVVFDAVSGVGAALALVALGWAPALALGNRSVYDRLTGLTVARVTFTREPAAA